MLRRQGLSLRAIGERCSVSEASVRRALSEAPEAPEVPESLDGPGSLDGPESGGAETVCAATVSAPEPVVEAGTGVQVGAGPESVTAAVVPVLADPLDRGAERVLAAFGMIPYAPPVFTGCARAPLAGLFLAVPALSATGLLETAHTTYGAVFPDGFYSLDTMLCESVFRFTECDSTR